jgi:hypothetical protein
MRILPAPSSITFCRFQVAVDDAALVRRSKARTYLTRYLRCLVGREPADPADHGSEVFSIHILHREEKSSPGLADVKYAANIGMRDLPCSAHFGVKPGKRSGILRKCHGEKFQRHDLSELQVLGAVNFAHSAAPGQGHYAVAFQNHLPRCEAASANGV